MHTKTCTECKISKQLSDFGKDSREKDLLRKHCKLCNNKHAAEYYSRVGISGARKNVAQRNRRFIYEYLQQSKCVDCGEKRWQVLEFDHVRGKKNRNVSSMITGTWSLASIAAEISKCDVRCANCHRMKTCKDFNFLKADWDNNSQITYPSKKYTTTYRGEAHLSAKLTEADVHAIRKEYIPRINSHSKLAKKYNVSESVIQAVLKRRTWKHI